MELASSSMGKKWRMIWKARRHVLTWSQRRRHFNWDNKRTSANNYSLTASSLSLCHLITINEVSRLTRIYAKKLYNARMIFSTAREMAKGEDKTINEGDVLTNDQRDKPSDKDQANEQKWNSQWWWKSCKIPTNWNSTAILLFFFVLNF